MQSYLGRLESAATRCDAAELRAVLMEAVRGYQPEGEIVERLWLVTGEST